MANTSQEGRMVVGQLARELEQVPLRNSIKNDTIYNSS